MKRIMILYAQYTGYGHKSIASALCDHFKSMPDVEVELVDGFSLIGRIGVQASKAYGPVTRRASDLWKMTYSLSNINSKALLMMLSTLIHDRFMKKLSIFMPDLIVTVHSMFNSSVLNILEHYHMDIPFVVLQADIINIHNTWCDPRADLTLCPTQEALTSSLAHGMPEERLRVCGFPTREQFCETARHTSKEDYTEDRPIRCMLMSGGEGSGNLQKYAEELLKHVNSQISIICGRNERVKEQLSEALMPDYADRLTIYGFLDNIQDIMVQSDLIIARGSPNSMMEAVVLTVPLVITGSLPGQEADNPALMVSHNLGVVCENPESMPAIVNNLMRDNGKRLREIRAAQLEYRDLDNARHIAELLAEMAHPGERVMPHYRKRFPLNPQTRYTMRKLRQSYRRLKQKYEADE